MNSKKLFVIIVISAILLTSCVLNKKDTIIKVNGQNITQSQFDKAFKEATSNSIFAKVGLNKKDKQNVIYLMVKNNVVDDLIEKTLINQEIEKKHIKVTKSEADKELNAIIAKVGSQEEFDKMLKQNGISSSQFKKDLYEKIKLKKLVETFSDTKISDADAKKFYNANMNKYKYPEKIRASHILISANPERIRKKIVSNPMNKELSEVEIQTKVDKELAARHEKAEKILALVKKNPNDFAKIAKENSDDKGSVKKGGDLGFFTRQGFIEPFTKTAFSQKLNTVGEIVQSAFGYHIILVKEQMKAGQEPFEKVKAEIISEMENQAQEKSLEMINKDLKKQAKIEYINPEYSPTPIQDVLTKKPQKTKD